MRQLNITVPKKLQKTSQTSYHMTDKSKIKVKGRAYIEVSPDMYRLNVTIEHRFNTNQEAYTEGKKNLIRLEEITNELGLENIQFESKQLNVSGVTERQYNDNKEYIGNKKVGFKLSQVLFIDLPIDNEILDKLLTSIQEVIPDSLINIEGFVSHYKEYKQKTMKLAAQDAKEKAELLVEALGAKLGFIHEINYDSGRTLSINPSTITARTSSPLDLLEPDEISLNLSLQKQSIGSEVEIIWEVIKP